MGRFGNVALSYFHGMTLMWFIDFIDGRPLSMGVVLHSSSRGFEFRVMSYDTVFTATGSRTVA
jgi:hypothetical protein